MNRLLLFALGVILHPSITVRDVDGVLRTPLKADQGHASALIFITNDCPISNYYSHEIRRICEAYGPRGLQCSLVYTDPTLKDAVAAQHAREYGHGDYPRIVDRDHALVAAAGATITPEVVVIRSDATVAYRGRIDDNYIAIGKKRTVVTEHDWRDALDSVFSGKAVAKPEVPAAGCYIPDRKFFPN